MENASPPGTREDSRKQISINEPNVHRTSGRWPKAGDKFAQFSTKKGYGS